jgi:dephospho-CoA kinase
VRFCPDEWKHDLDIDYYDEDRRTRLEGRLWQLGQELLELGQSVILEYGFWAREERDELRLTARRIGVPVELHFLDVPVDELWRRLEVRNKRAEPGTAPIKHEDLLKWIEQHWEAPDTAELALFDRPSVPGALPPRQLVGGMEFDKRVMLSDWRPEWASDFEELSKTLSAVLDGIAIRVDHIGSTSVPGLRAKDVIDVQVIVAELESNEISQALGRMGFEQRMGAWNLRDHVPAGWVGNPARWSKLVFAPVGSFRPSNVHVRRSGAPNERYALLFRDFLRSNSEARDAWGRFKTQLALTSSNLSEYGAVKDPATDVLLALAERWATDTSWKVPLP